MLMPQNLGSSGGSSSGDKGGRGSSSSSGGGGDDNGGGSDDKSGGGSSGGGSSGGEGGDTGCAGTGDEGGETGPLHHQKQVHPQHVQTDPQTAIHLLHPLQYARIVLPTVVRHHLLLVQKVLLIA